MANTHMAKLDEELILTYLNEYADNRIITYSDLDKRQLLKIARCLLYLTDRNWRVKIKKFLNTVKHERGLNAVVVLKNG